MKENPASDPKANPPHTSTAPGNLKNPLNKKLTAQQASDRDRQIYKELSKVTGKSYYFLGLQNEFESKNPLVKQSAQTY